jgi:antirestriction protein ArdC
MADDIQQTKGDLRDRITGRIIESLEKGVMPWRKGWTNENSVANGLPRNATSDRVYNGGNRLILMLEAMDKGYQDPRWVTFNQANALGGSVSKGEKSTQVEYWDEMHFSKRKDVDITLNGAKVRLAQEPEKNAKTVQLSNGQQVDTQKLVVQANGANHSWKQAERSLNLLFAKVSHVFNVQQCNGLNIEPIPETKDIPPVAKIAAVVQLAEGMKKDGLTIREGGNEAYYSPGRDMIQLPKAEQFESPEAYAGTLLHELGHATGGQNRLNRPLSSGFATPEYAREELVAELCSAFASAETGVQFNDNNHAAYIGSWLSVLKEDKHAVFAAAKDASKAVDYMLEKGRDIDISKVIDPVLEKAKEQANPAPTVTIAPEPEPEALALTRAQREALQAFEQKHGDEWKEKLSTAWETGKYKGVNKEQAASLQQVRNTYGPEWLSELKDEDLADKFVVSISYEKFSQDDLQAGEPSERGFEVDKETMNQDDLQKYARDYGISQPSASAPQMTSNVWFSSTEPTQSKEYFQYGEHTYHSLHIHEVNGEKPQAKDYQRIADLIDVKFDQPLRESTAEIAPEKDPEPAVEAEAKKPAGRKRAAKSRAKDSEPAMEI